MGCNTAGFQLCFSGLKLLPEAKMMKASFVKHENKNSLYRVLSKSFLLFYSYLILLFLFTKLCQCLLSCRSCFYNISSAFSLVTVIPKHCLRDYVIFHCIYSFPKCCSSLSSFFFFCHYIMLWKTSFHINFQTFLFFVE